MTIEELIQGHNVSEERKESLTLAIAAGCTEKNLATLRDATRLNRADYIHLPLARYETLSRGKGWCRKGRGDSAEWGEREKAGYRVGPGHWVVGGSDGFRRKSKVEWDVKHVAVGSETWTIAN